MSAGNMPLAQSDLQKVYARYGSTGAGVRGGDAPGADRLRWRQIPGRASTCLQKVAGSSAASGVQSTILSLEGDGYAQMEQAADAAKAYEDAADATILETERAFQRAKAARAYQAAGDTAKARQIWTASAERSEGPDDGGRGASSAR